MKSRTSYSDLTAFKKDIFRFAPVWILYTVCILLLLVTLNRYGESYDAYAYRNMEANVQAFGIINLIYGGVCAMMLFGDLYKTRLCYSLHALPQRREHWLLSHVAAGLLFSLVPNILAALLMMSSLGEYWFLALYWLLAATVQFVFFFGVGTLSALLTGNRFAMLTVYAGFQFVAILAYCTVDFLYVPMLTGVVTDFSAFTPFSPVVHMMEFDFFRFRSTHRVDYTALPGSYSSTINPYFYEYLGLEDGWGYLAVLAGVGLLALVGAWLLYRKRHLECAGDFVAFPKLKGVFCAILTACIALCFALVGTVTTNDYILWLTVGLIVGYFGSLMLLERRLKVLRKKTALGFAIVVVVTALSFWVVDRDLLGIESWTPEADRVESVTVSNRPAAGEYYLLGYYADRLEITLEGDADIARIIDAHEDILSRLDFRSENPSAKTHRVTLTYKMKSGRTVVRTYIAPASGKNYDILMSYLYTRDAVLGFSDYQTAAENLEYMHWNGSAVPAQKQAAVLQALQLDFDAGNIELGKDNGNIFLDYSIRGIDGTMSYRTIFFTEQATHLMELLADPQLQMGYSDWEDFLKRVSISFEGKVQTGQQRQELLEALRKDVEAGTLIAGNFSQDTIFVVEYRWRDTDGVYDYRTFCIDKRAENTMNWYYTYVEGRDL